jgi:hypothetical protein
MLNCSQINFHHIPPYLRLPIDIVQHIIKLNRDAAERAASTIFQKYTRGSRPRLAFRDMGTFALNDSRVRARIWRESHFPYYDSTAPPGLHEAHCGSGEERRQFVAGFRRHVRGRLLLQ